MPFAGFAQHVHKPNQQAAANLPPTHAIPESKGLTVPILGWTEQLSRRPRRVCKFMQYSQHLNCRSRERFWEWLISFSVTTIKSHMRRVYNPALRAHLAVQQSCSAGITGKGMPPTGTGYGLRNDVSWICQHCLTLQTLPSLVLLAMRCIFMKLFAPAPCSGDASSSFDRNPDVR